MNSREEILKAQQDRINHIDDSFIKGKKAMIGEVREHGGVKFKKIAEGKWVPADEAKGADDGSEAEEKFAKKKKDDVRAAQAKQEADQRKKQAEAQDDANRGSKDKKPKADEREYTEAGLRESISRVRSAMDNTDDPKKKAQAKERLEQLKGKHEEMKAAKKEGKDTEFDSSGKTDGMGNSQDSKKEDEKIAAGQSKEDDKFEAGLSESTQKRLESMKAAHSKGYRDSVALELKNIAVDNGMSQDDAFDVNFNKLADDHFPQGVSDEMYRKNTLDFIRSVQTENPPKTSEENQADMKASMEGTSKKETKSLSDKIDAVLEFDPNATNEQIAEQLGVDKKEVKEALKSITPTIEKSASETVHDQINARKQHIHNSITS